MGDQAAKKKSTETGKRKSALLKKPSGKILNFLEVSALISNKIEDVEEKKHVLTFIILNRLLQFLSWLQ